MIVLCWCLCEPCHRLRLVHREALNTPQLRGTKIGLRFGVATLCSHLKPAISGRLVCSDAFAETIRLSKVVLRLVDALSGRLGPPLNRSRVINWPSMALVQVKAKFIMPFTSPRSASALRCLQ